VSHERDAPVSSCKSDEEVSTLAEATRTTDATPSLLWRIVLVAAGAGVAMAGWTLVMTALLAFIGLPLFIFGLAMMQSAGGDRFR